MGVAPLFDAYLERKKTSSTPCYYVGITDDITTKDWFLKTRTEKVAQQHMDGSLVIAGFPKSSSEMPADLI